MAAIGAASAAVVAFGKDSVQAGSQFDSSMSQVAATMGFTTDQLNDSTSKAAQTMEQLRKFAQEMGATTAFSATEASEALNYMALAGYDAETSMKMLPNVLNLAAAGGMDLARASDMLTDTQSALGLSMEQTEELTNKMAVTASKSNTSVEQLGDAMLTLGATGKMLAGGTTELSTALGILADNGTKGSEGGTRLRNILLSLGSPTDKAAEVLENLGVSAYDANGNMRPLEDTFADLNKALAPMTTEERNNIINKIFNKTDIADVNYLLGVSSDRWDTLSESINNSKGAAEDMANVQLDNLDGDITLFQSALEGVKIAVSDGVTPALRDFVQIGTTGLSDIAAALQQGDLEGAFAAIGTFLGSLVQKIIDMLPELIDAAISLLTTFGRALLDNLDVIIDAAFEIVMALVDAIIDALPEIATAAIEIIGKLAIGIGEALPTLIPKIIEVVLTIVMALIDNVDLLIDGAIALVVGLAEGIINSLPILIEKAPVIISKLVAAIIANLPKILAAGGKLIGELALGIVQAIPALVMKVPQLISSLWNAITGRASDMQGAGKNLVSGMWEGWKSAWNNMVNNVINSAKNLISSVKNTFGIHSPSRVFSEIGEYCVAGFDEGTEDMFDQIEADNFARNVEASISTQAAGQSNYVIVQSDIILEGDAAGVFRLVRQENRKQIKSTGYNPLMV